MIAEKQLLLDEIKEKIDQSKALFLASYQKLSPNMTAGFRNTLRTQKASMEVVRKRILLKAAEAAGIQLDPSTLEGHIAVIFADDDPVATTKLIFSFSRENENTLKILGGLLEGKFCSGSDIELISQLPGKDEMRAQFLGLLEAPMSQTLAVVEALLSSVMHCLENKVQKSEQ